MRKSRLAIVAVFVIGGGFGLLAGQAGLAGTTPPASVETLMRADLDVIDDIEVIVSRVDIRPGVTLPQHYHPGEEFIYVLDGTAAVRQPGEDDIWLAAGDVFKVPLEQVHTAVTGDAPASAIVFRVHRKGEPERIPVE